MIIDYITLSLEFDNRNQVCSYLDENRDKIKSVVSISPNLHSNKYVLFYQEYIGKEFKVMKKKTLKAIKTRHKIKQLKKNKS